MVENETKRPDIVIFVNGLPLVVVELKSCMREEPFYGVLRRREANGIIFTTMQKFEESADPLSKRRNIIVMADEAHRSQYGLVERVKKDGMVVVGAARVIRDSLPGATFIGFTGTPVSSKDHNTREVFGEYIDIYDMTQAVEDGATRPVYYESRVMNLGLNEDVLRQIDATYELLALNANEQDIERSKKELGNMDICIFCSYRRLIHYLLGKLFCFFQQFIGFNHTLNQVNSFGSFSSNLFACQNQLHRS